MAIVIHDRADLEHQIIRLNQQQRGPIRTLTRQFGVSHKLLPASLDAELSRLQRCNQERLLVVIRLLPASLGAEPSRLQRCNRERLLVVIRLLPASLGAKLSRLQRCNQVRLLVVIRLFPASLGAELSRLQRCNLERLLVVIREHGLTWRETRQVVTVLLTKVPQEYEAILSNPRATIIKPQETPRCVPDEPHGLALSAQRLMRGLQTLEQHCLEVAVLLSGAQSIQHVPHELQSVKRGCAHALISLDHVRRLLVQQAQPH